MATIPVTTPSTQPVKSKPVPKQVRPRLDTRLFICIGLSYPARKAGLFVILTALRNALGLDAKLLKEVQKVKSGYALCTGSQETLTALESKILVIGNTITDCTIERQLH